MKLKSIKKRIWGIVIIITTLIGILPAQANTTETPVKDVELDGRWDDPIRSATTNCPITVFTDGYLLTVKNVSPDRDMTIRITDMAKGASFMKIIFLKYRALTSQFLLQISLQENIN